MSIILSWRRGLGLTSVSLAATRAGTLAGNDADLQRPFLYILLVVPLPATCLTYFCAPSHTE